MVAFMFPSILDGHEPDGGRARQPRSLIAHRGPLPHARHHREESPSRCSGTFSALPLTAVLAWVFSTLAHFAGDGSGRRLLPTERVDARSTSRVWCLPGVIIGGLGVLDDVTVTQVVGRVAAPSGPAYGARRLSAPGRRSAATTSGPSVITQELAYAGASMPLLLIFTQAGRGLGAVAAGERVAVDLVPTLVGSIGLVAAVPLTTAPAAFIVARGSSAALREPPPPAPRRLRPAAGDGPTWPGRAGRAVGW